MAKTAAKKAEQPHTTAQQLGSLIKSARDIMRKDKGLNGDLDLGGRAAPLFAGNLWTLCESCNLGKSDKPLA